MSHSQMQMEKELESIQASIHGLADNLDLLAKKGRRFIMLEELTRVKKGNSKSPCFVYLFNDVLLFTEKTSRKGATYKYVSHMNIKDILFIDADSKDKQYSFGIYHKESKKKTKFVAKDSMQKSTWKHSIETQIEKHSPTANSFDGEPTAMGSPSRSSWDSSMADCGSYFGSYGSACELESGDESSTTGESPPNPPNPSLSDCSSTTSADEELVDDTTDGTRSDGYDSAPEDCVVTQTSDGQPIIAHSNLHTITWWLISYADFNDPILIKTFLHSLLSLSTAEDLFETLTVKIYRLDCPVPKAISLRYSLCDVQKRVTYFLHIWLEHFFDRDFFPDKKLFGELLQFFEMLRLDERFEEANRLKLMIIRVNKKRLVDRGIHRFSPTAKNSGTSSISTSNDNIKGLSSRSGGNHSALSIPPHLSQETKFIDWNVTAVAEQFVLIEYGLFKAVELKEISNLAWKSEHPRKTALNVVNIFNRFDLVSQWVATEVVMAQSHKQRITIIEKLIQLAQKCLELRNYNSLMEIVAGGLNRGSVQRMKKAWEGVPHASKETFRALNSVVDSLQNYKNYRDQLKKTILPCLPYFGIFLRDLTFTDVGNPSKIGDNINFEKIYMTSKILKDIQMFQKTPYPFEEDDALQPLLRRLLAMPEEMLYKHSQNIEPSQLAASY